MTRGAAFVLGVVLAACRASPPEPRPAPSAPSPTAASGGSRAPAPSGLLAYTELVTGGATTADALPLVVALHGLGDRPEAFIRLFQSFPARARIVAPHPDARYSTGFAWFPPGDRVSPEAAERFSAMGDRVVAFAKDVAARKPTVGKPIVMGFSQGGGLSLEIGLHHGADVAAVFPVGSFLPPGRVPSRGDPPSAPIEAFHGLADPLVAADTTRATYRAIRDAGVAATLHEYPGIEHEIPEPERGELLTAIAAACDRAGK